MRIQPVATTNYDTNFKRLKISDPMKCDIDVLEAIIKNKSIQEFAIYLSEKGKDLNIMADMKPSPIIMALHDDKWKVVAIDRNSKDELLKKLAAFDYKKFLEENEVKKASVTKRNELLLELMDFNAKLKLKQKAAAEACSDEFVSESKSKTEQKEIKKRNFFERLFGLNK